MPTCNSVLVIYGITLVIPYNINSVLSLQIAKTCYHITVPDVILTNMAGVYTRYLNYLLFTKNVAI